LRCHRKMHMKIVIERNAYPSRIARGLKDFDVLRVRQTDVTDVNRIYTTLLQQYRRPRRQTLIQQDTDVTHSCSVADSLRKFTFMSKGLR